MRLFLTSIIALLLAINVQAATVIMPKSGAPAKPGQYCTDLAGVLTEPQRVAVNEQLAQLDRDTGAELLVYIDRTLNGKPIEDFGREAFRSWGVGKKDKNNGMVFFLFTADRKMRVEVGYGLEGAVPDSVAKQIIAQGVAPKLKKGAEDWNGGVVEAVNQLAVKIRKEGSKPTASQPKPQPDFFGSGSQSSSPSSSATSPSSKGSSSGASSKQPSAAQDRDHQAAGVLVGLLAVVVVAVVVALLISRRNRLERERLERYEQAMRDRDRRIREQLERERRNQATKPQRNYTTPAVMAAASTAAAVALVQPRKEPARPKKPAESNPAPTRRSYSDDDDDSSSRRSSWSSSSSDYGSSSSSSYDSGGGSCGGGGASSDF